MLGFVPLPVAIMICSASQSIRESRIIGRRENPCVLFAQKERKILGVIVAVMGENVEAGQRIDFLHIEDILRQDRRDAQDCVVVERWVAVIGMNKTREALHVNPPVLSPSKRFVPKYRPLAGVEQGISGTSMP